MEFTYYYRLEVSVRGSTALIERATIIHTGIEFRSYIRAVMKGYFSLVEKPFPYGQGIRYSDDNGWKYYLVEAESMLLACQKVETLIRAGK